MKIKTGFYMYYKLESDYALALHVKLIFIWQAIAERTIEAKFLLSAPSPAKSGKAGTIITQGRESQ